MLTWFTRAFARRKNDGFSPSAASGDYRDVLFPDERAENELPEWRPFFNPFNFRVHVTGSRVVSDAREAILRGELVRAKELTADVPRLMAPDESVAHMLDLTSGLHELRHFHDLFGTTWGFAHVSAIIDDGVEFSRVLSALKQGGMLRLPLAAWASSAGAPLALSAYMRRRRKEVEWFDVVDGTTQPQRLPGRMDPTANVIVMILLKGVQARLPAVPMNMTRLRDGAEYHVMVPLGARALMEGNAVVLQRALLHELFGAAAADRVMASLRTMRGDQAAVYLAVDRYLSSIFRAPFNATIQTNLADLAMMSATYNEAADLPGLRLRRAAAAAYEQGGLTGPIDPLPYMDGIARACEWLSSGEVVTRALREADGHLANIPVAPSAWAHVLRAVVKTHRRILQIRQGVPGVLADPHLYMAAIKYLPPPPVMLEDGRLVVRGEDQDAADGFAHWFLLESLQGQLLFSNRLQCPLSAMGVHTCGGDMLGKARWADNSGCEFARLVETLGIRDCDIATA